MAKKTAPSKEAEAAAKEIVKKWSEIQSAGAQVTRDMTGGDPWGPSLGDYRDGEEEILQRVAKIIDKHRK